MCQQIAIFKQVSAESHFQTSTSLNAPSSLFGFFQSAISIMLDYKTVDKNVDTIGQQS